MSKLDSLRTLHPHFIYESYCWKLEKANPDRSDLQLSFNFTLENSQDPQTPIHFHPTVTIQNVTQRQIDAIPSQIFENFIFHIGLMEIPSYWKASCSPEIIIRSGHLNTEQISWWNNLLIKGLGEFFYTNNIDFTAKNFVTWKIESEENGDGNGKEKEEEEEKKTIYPILNTPYPIPNTKYQIPKYQIPLGGGKDSALTLGIFEKNNLSYSCLILEPHSPATQAIIEKSHPEQVITASRVIDPQLLKLNSLGYMNGHTPFSAYLAFLSSFTALLFGIEHVVLSNERSANEGNVEFHDQTINHQYSKTFEFENNFREYMKQWIWKKEKSKNQAKSHDILTYSHTKLPDYQFTRLPKYYSLLRPLYEIQIAQLFSQYPQYHSAFRSCNVGQKQNIWCHSCPKCLFVFTILFPFIETEKLTTQIFNHNLYEDEGLLPLMLELLGETEHKPLECVGTYNEVLVAVHLSVEKYKNENQPLPFILEKIEKNVLNKKTNLQEMSENLLRAWNNEHNLPDDLEEILKKTLKQQSVPNTKTQTSTEE